MVILQNISGYMQVQGTPPGWTIIRPPNEVSAMLIDNDTIWTGGKEGVVLVDRITGNRVNLKGAPSFGYVRQIIMDHSGTIWIGHDGGLVTYRNGIWHVIAPGPGIPFTKVLSLAAILHNCVIPPDYTYIYPVRVPYIVADSIPAFSNGQFVPLGK